MEKTGVKIVAKNSKAFHEYFVEERFEAGIELFGTEVKSIRLGTLNLKDAWCSVKDGELWVKLELGLAKGKKLYDKRQDAANKDARRQIDRAMKERNH